MFHVGRERLYFLSNYDRGLVFMGNQRGDIADDVTECTSARKPSIKAGSDYDDADTLGIDWRVHIHDDAHPRELNLTMGGDVAISDSGQGRQRPIERHLQVYGGGRGESTW